MAHGKRFDEWDRTSLLAALIHNDPQGINARLAPRDFNPLSENLPSQANETVTTLTNPADLAALLGNKLEIVR